MKEEEKEWLKIIWKSGCNLNYLKNWNLKIEVSKIILKLKFWKLF